MVITKEYEPTEWEIEEHEPRSTLRTEQLLVHKLHQAAAILDKSTQENHDLADWLENYAALLAKRLERPAPKEWR